MLNRLQYTIPRIEEYGVFHDWIDLSLVSMSHAVLPANDPARSFTRYFGAAITGTHDLTFRIYDDQNAGSVLWSEVLTVQFNNGYFATVLGSDEINNPLDSTTSILSTLYGTSSGPSESSQSQNCVDLSTPCTNVRCNRISSRWFCRG